jgi:hypothetical protein
MSRRIAHEVHHLNGDPRDNSLANLSVTTREIERPEEKPYCCHIPCSGAAQWEIWHVSGDPYDSTHACTEHVGELLTDAPEHRVYPIRTGAPSE